MDASLKSVDFEDADGVPIDGLVSTRNPTDGLSLDEASVVKQAACFDDVSYVFFRRFSDGRSSQAVAFVVANEDEHLDNAQLAELHNALWLHGVAPLVYVAGPARVDILSCARGPDFWQDDELIYRPAEELKIASAVNSELEKRRRFSAFRLADGTFWEDQRNHTLADHEKAAHQSLIQAIVDTDQALDGGSNPALRRLLLLMVLIKYLEDRQVFPRPAWFGHYHKGARSFFDVLKGGEPESVLRLLRTLEDKFNGDVFALPADTPLTQTALRNFATLVEAKTVDKQRYLWAPFSFAHLPVEVISHLYQRFVQGSTAVYTPPFLAALLLDFVMPWDHLTGYERVLDPSCGSGVFLVGAFRRLVAARRSMSPDVEELKSILREQIFGIELDSSAVDLSAFSLSLAVCDCLQPNVIWNDLKFDRLRDRNLLEADFFDCRPTDGAGEGHSLGPFDIIVGNPPFESDFSEPARRVSTERSANEGSIPDKQIAYLFLDRCVRFLTKDGQLCLIQPSGFLYNLQSHAFRSSLARTRRWHTILDFTSIRALFSGAGADTKIVAVILGSEAEKPIQQLTFRRTYEATQQIGFELDHYDRYQLTIDEVTANPRAARANLLGGGRLGMLASRLCSLRSLRQFVQEKGWLMGEGFIVGNKKHEADYLTGLPLLPTSELKDNGFSADAISTVNETHFEAPRQAAMYQPPMVLIKEHESLPIAFWDETALAYKDKIVGILAPPGEASDLHDFFQRIRSHRELLRFAAAINGSQSLVGKATALLKSDIVALPFPEDESDLELTDWESVLADDTLNYFTEFVRLGQNSKLLRKTADTDVLAAYSALYCQMLGSIYDNLRASEPVFLDGLICQPFFFGEEPAIEWLGSDCEEQLRKLVFDNSRDTLRTVRIVRYYHDNVVFIVKPNRLRYWIKSTAIRDADDTLIELRRQGY